MIYANPSLKLQGINHGVSRARRRVRVNPCLVTGYPFRLARKGDALSEMEAKWLHHGVLPRNLIAAFASLIKASRSRPRSLLTDKLIKPRLSGDGLGIPFSPGFARKHWSM
jgi:hypothetical protein